MAIIRYASNIARSATYALPQILKNRVPNIHSLVSQITNKDQRENTTTAFREIKSILKEDVLGLMRKGLDNAKSEAKSGKLYQTEEEENASFDAAMGIDSNAFNNDFLDGEVEMSPEDQRTAQVASSAAQAGAAAGVESAAAHLGDNPTMRMNAEANLATAKYARAGLASGLVVGNMLRNSMMAHMTISNSIHQFQATIQHSYYRQQLEHSTAMMGLTSELVARVGELHSVSIGAAAASDQVMAAFTGRQSDFATVFDSDGGFNASAYVGVLATRFKRAVGDGSMFKMMGSSLAAAPLTAVFTRMMDSMIPKNFGKQLEQFNDFMGKLGAVTNERARNLSTRLQAQGGMRGGLGKFINSLTIAPPTAVNGPDLSKIIRGKAVAFDGYAHRALVEIIPSHLSDMHSELIAIRKGQGFSDPQDRKLYDYKTGRFVSEKETKRKFEATVDNESINHFDRVHRTIGDGGNTQTAKNLRDAFRVLRNEQLSINKGDHAEFGNQIDKLVDRLERVGKTKDAESLRLTRDSMVQAREKHGARFSYELQSAISRSDAQRHRAYDGIEREEGVQRMMYSGEAGADGIGNGWNFRPRNKNKSRNDITRNTNELLPTIIPPTPPVPPTPGPIIPPGTGPVPPVVPPTPVIPPVPSPIIPPGTGPIPPLVPPTPVIPPVPGPIIPPGSDPTPPAIPPASKPKKKAATPGFKRNRDAAPIREAVKVVGDSTDFEKGAQGSVYRDDAGKVTLKSILAIPVKVASKAIESVENRISDALFGDGTGMKEGLFKKMNRLFMGDVDSTTGKRTGPIGRIVDYIKVDVFGPLKRAIMGDPSQPGTDTSILGTTKRWFKQAVDSGKEFLFGKNVMQGDGNLKREGGMFGGVVNFFSGQSKKLKEYLMGNGPSGDKVGLLNSLREKFTSVATRLQTSLFGSVDVDGRRSGGVFGNGIQKGKDFVNNLWDKFQTSAVQPLGKLLFGAVGADGRRAGGAFGSAFQKGKDFVSRIYDDAKTTVLKPLQAALFGKGTTVDDGFGNVTYKGRGIIPTLSDTLKTSIINPMMTSLFGEKSFSGTDAKGNPIFKRKGGAFGSISAALKDAFAPLKDTFVGPEGIWTNLKRGLSDTFRDLKTSLFGESKDGKTIMQRIGDKISEGIKVAGDWMQNALKPITNWIQQGGEWMRTKVFEPFGTWLNDPKTGFITRMRKGTATFFYGKANEETGKREGGLFGTVKKQMDLFFYGNPEKGTKGFVERVVEPAKKFVLNEIWTPLKTSVVEMWDGTKEFFKKEIFAPLKGVLNPFVVEAKEQWRLMKEWVKGPLWESIKGIGGQINEAFHGVFGTSFTDMMRKNILDPIKDTLSSVRKFLGTALGSLLKLPVNILRGASDELKASQIRRGIAKLDPAERERIIREKKINTANIPAGSGSSLNAPPVVVKPLPGEKVTAVPKTEGVKIKNDAKDTAAVKVPGPVKMTVDTASTSDKSDKKAAPAVRQDSKVLTVTPPSAVIPGQKEVEKAKTTTAGTTSTKDEKVAQTVKPVVPQAQPIVNDAKATKEAGATPIVQPVKHNLVNDASQPAVTQHGAIETDKAIRATADNTHNIYQFVAKHLWGVGKNVERIVQHFKIKDTAVGGNTGEKRAPTGILGKLRQIISNPLGFVRDIVGGAFDFMRKQVSRVFDVAKGVIMIPLRIIGKGLGLISDMLVGARKMFGGILSVTKDLVVSVLGTALKVTGVAIRETAKAVSGAFISITKAIPALVSTVASASVSILKAGGQLLGGAVKLTGQLATTVLKMGGAILATAVRVTKDVVTGLARITFDAIGASVKAIFGRSKRKSDTAPLTPVYVVGGFLADVKGGARSLAEAKTGSAPRRIIASVKETVQNAYESVKEKVGNVRDAIKDNAVKAKTAVSNGIDKVKDVAANARTTVSNGMTAAKETTERGVDAVKNGYAAIKERTGRMASDIADGKWKARLLSVGEKTRDHMAAVRNGFSKFGSLLMSALPLIASGIGTMVAFFTKGKFISMLANLAGGRMGGLARGVGGLARGAGGVIARGAGAAASGAGAAARSIGGVAATAGRSIAGAASTVGSTALTAGKSLVGKMGGIKGVGIGAAAGLGGTLIKSLADDNMEDGAAKTAVKTGGSMLQYGATGAMIGSVIPGLGTAVGAGIGAAVGAVVENWDAIADAAKSLGKMLWTLPEKISSFVSNAGSMMWTALKSIPDKLSTIMSDAGSMIMTGLKALPSMMLDALKSVVTGFVSKNVEAAKSVSNAASSAWNWVTGGDKAVAPAAAAPSVVKPVLPAPLAPPAIPTAVAPKPFAPIVQEPVLPAFKTVFPKTSAVANAPVVSAASEPIVSRATGGKLGASGTLVGEIGPEILNNRGEVISGGRTGGQFNNPALVQAAQSREDTMGSILERVADNTLWSARALDKLINGAGFGPLPENKSDEFKPLKGTPRAETQKSGKNSDDEGGNGVLKGVGELASTVWQGASNIGNTALGAAKNTGSQIMQGDFSGAASSAWNGIKNIGTSVSQAASAVSQTAAGSTIAAKLGGDQGQKVLMEAAAKAGITTPTEQAMFLSQMDHESGGFRKLSESFSYSPDRLTTVFPKYFRTVDDARAVVQQGPEAIAEKVYGGRMGNRERGDGFKFRGRGFIQLTGRSNYEAASKALGLDLVSNPDQAADPKVAADVATWYWKSRGVSKPAIAGDVVGATKIINGGTNGLADRQSKYTSYLAKLNQVPVAAQAQAGGAIKPLKTAMDGGWMGSLPTLVGEREPEILSPDGRIHSSVDAYLTSANSDVSGLAVNTAVKEAARRASNGPDMGGSAAALSKIAAAAAGGSNNGASEETMKAILSALQAIVINTQDISKIADKEPVQNSSLVVDASRPGAVFSMPSANPRPSRGPGVSSAMQALLAG